VSVSKMRTVQQRAVDLVYANPWFDGFEVIADLPGDIQTKLLEAIGKLGICIVCMISPSEPITQGNKVAIKLQLAFMITENVTLNRDIASGGSGKTAEEAVEQLIQTLHYKDNGLGIVRTPAVFRVGNPAFQRVPDEEFFIFRVNFDTEVPL